MGKKKRSKTVMPWCWYCEREFEDQPTLIIHQRAKHFRCPLSDCKKKYQTLKVMAQHAQTQHDFTVESVPNALPHRNDMTVDICGMNGIPEDDIYDREKDILGTSPVKGISYDEISEDQLRSQVAQFQATGTTNGFEHHYPQKDVQTYNHIYPFYQSSYPWPGYTYFPVDAKSSQVDPIETPPPSIGSSPHSIEPPPPPPPPEEAYSPPPPPPPPPSKHSHSGTVSKKRRVSPLVPDRLRAPTKLIPVFQRTDLSPDEWRALRISTT